jgi:hypothetical protein
VVFLHEKSDSESMVRRLPLDECRIESRTVTEPSPTIHTAEIAGVEPRDIRLIQ